MDTPNSHDVDFTMSGFKNTSSPPKTPLIIGASRTMTQTTGPSRQANSSTNQGPSSVEERQARRQKLSLILTDVLSILEEDEFAFSGDGEEGPSFGFGQ